MATITIYTKPGHYRKVKAETNKILQKLHEKGITCYVHQDPDQLSPLMWFEGTQYLGLKEIRAQLARTLKELNGKRLPNRARTVAGKWHKLHNAEFKIERTKRPYYKDGTPTYRITIRNFPRKHWQGIIPAEIALEDGEGGAHFWYDVSEKDTREEVFKLLDLIMPSNVESAFDYKSVNSWEVTEQIKKLRDLMTPRN